MCRKDREVPPGCEGRTGKGCLGRSAEATKLAEGGVVLGPMRGRWGHLLSSSVLGYETPS